MFWWRFVECKSFSGVKPFTFFRSLKKSATQREIKAAYYQLSKKFHPDVAGSSKDAAQKFLDISEAYECLRDPNRRRVYDNQTTGGGGRYTGDYGQDPFGNYTSRPFDRRYGNPFHSRQFTQEEYERIWREFNRLKNERSNYDERINSERQRMWAEFNRNRAARWNEFHKRYPEGPPGSFRFEWRFHNNNSEQQRLYNGWELLRKIMMIYFVSFFVISLVKIVLQSAGNARDNFIPSEANKIPLTEKEKLANIMNTMPISDKEKINAVMEKVPISKYPVNSSENGLNITYVPSNEIASGHSEIGQNISYVPQSSPSLNSGYTNSENNSEFSMYQNETSRKTY